MGKAIPEHLFVDFRRNDSGARIRDKVLTGLYDIVSEHHGRPVYRKRRDGQCGEAPASSVVVLHYWDGRGRRHLDANIGWWFAARIGGDEVWAFHESDSFEPPRRGWVCHDLFGLSSDEFELVIEPRDGDAVPASRQPSPQQAPPEDAQSRSDRVDSYVERGARQYERSRSRGRRSPPAPVGPGHRASRATKPRGARPQ